ncbi:MAG TPA: ribbon-helix-helix protein, CopG family [Terrimicrobiaceae bacterium]
MRTADRLGRRRGTGKVQRISISLPEGIFRELDEMVAERGLENRSKAIAEMIARFVLERREAAGDPVMAGIIALVYDESRGALIQRLFELERQYQKEVITSLHVQLKESHRMEVIIVQGPVHILKEITDKILSSKGVLSCRLTLTDIVIPQVHSAPTVKRNSHLNPVSGNTKRKSWKR